ncbi:MAG: glutaminyl-peptide cyclotransferase [Syntrophales bacterium]
MPQSLNLRYSVMSFLAVLMFAGTPECVHPDSCPEPVIRHIRVIRFLPHDPDAFTQGLAFDGGFFYEGTGRHGQSTLRKVDPETGRVVRLHRLKTVYFGEGISVAGDRIVQLTWRSGKGFIYDKETLMETGGFSYHGEGWGLAFDGSRFIMSDGSSVLRYLDARTLRKVRTLEVRSGTRRQYNLNELEYVNGRIFANIWGSDRIAVISPRSGCVQAWIDLSPLRQRVGFDCRAEVLNGIAYDKDGDRLYVTGKNWPRIFEIEILRQRTKGKGQKKNPNKAQHEESGV